MAKIQVPPFMCLLLTAVHLALPAPVMAQGSPLPGSSAPTPGAAPAPGNAAPLPGGSAPVVAPRSVGSAVPAPVPGQSTPAGALASYKTLPISYHAAQVRLEELRNLMPNIKGRDFQDLADNYLEWLSEMADGHWKLHQSFSKADGFKAQAEQERLITLKLGALKRQAMLLKAEFLIRENRHPEALRPLVEIVCAEPKTSTGESAYQLLKQIGYSDEVAVTQSGTSQPPAAVSAGGTN